jgi:hypothetical protein
MTSYVHKYGNQLAVILAGEKYLAVPTSNADVWLLNAAESGPGPGEPPTTGDQTFDWPFDPNTTVTSDEVAKWQVLGYVNNTGNSYGDHLHWETHIASPGGTWTSSNPGTHINPRTFMNTYQNVPVPGDPPIVIQEGY